MGGYAIQCRVTTEDPANNFAPDIGRVTSYRSGGGFGVRLDGGNAYTGATISPYYDSLLVKVTCWDRTFDMVCRKALRAISEEHIRGVKTNIPFVTNILNHPTFRAGKCHTKFIDEAPELFEFQTGRDRATKVLRYIAQIQVDNPSAERRQLDIPRFPPYQNTPPKCTGLKQLLDAKSPGAVRDWVLDQKKLLITDTTMRDAHQSLLSTRVRTRDMVKGAPGTAEILNDCFSLEKRGAHLLCIKDMSALLKPYAAKKLVTALKNEVGLPIHLHTHDASDNQVATYLMAAEAGVDIVDCAIDSMSSTTSQPSMNAIVTALQGQPRDTGLDPHQLQYLSDYWSDVRKRYTQFEADIRNPSTDIYRYEMPGGQYTNLRSQVESLGLIHQFEDVKNMYVSVNHMLGDIVKVTPSSKMVGDLAIFMVQNGLTPENILERGSALTYPDSVVAYFKGMMGQLSWGFPEDLQKIVLKGEEPITCRLGELLPPIDFDAARRELERFSPNPTDRSVISWCLYPKVVEDYCRYRQSYGYIMRMGSHVFFNGMRREVAVPDKDAVSKVRPVTLAAPDDKSQVGSSIPGMISKLNVKPGDPVEENQVVAVIKAMKMEINIVARIRGAVDQVLIKEGSTVKAGELIMTLKLQ